jgi:LmbE family N-acetylglucosaminyl deacetylase
MFMPDRTDDVVLVVAAHPDDEVLGCGGTIARVARAGRPVAVAILGEGVTSRTPQRDPVDPGAVAALRVCSRQAANVLGVRELCHFNLPDNRFDTVPLLNIVKLVEEVVARVRPTVVCTHDAGDLNIDHVLVHRAVLTATRPTGACPVRSVLTCEVPSATDWSFQQFPPAFRPTVFVDIAETLEAKIQALQQYDREVRAFPHPRSPEALRASAQRWGSIVGRPAAEAFALVRTVW